MYPRPKDFNIIGLVGLTISKIDQTGDTFDIYTTDGRHFRSYHDQDCCESVGIDTVEGNLDDLIGSPITVAEEDIDQETSPARDGHYVESFTWTIFTFATAKGRVVIKWLGESNGYYSESVSTVELT